MNLDKPSEEMWSAFCGRCRRLIVEDESKVAVEAAWAYHLDEMHLEVNYA